MPRASPWSSPRANFAEQRARLPVGSRGALHPVGRQDLAGNVKEWVWNGAGDGRRYILGGGWDEPPYVFNEPDAARRSLACTTSAFAASATRASRRRSCSRRWPGRHATTVARSHVRPGFEIYRRLYAYDRVPLPAAVEATDDATSTGAREQVSLPTAYGTERMKVFLSCRKRRRPRSAPWCAFPAPRCCARARSISFPISQFDFLVKSGAPSCCRSTRAPSTGLPS